MQVCLSFHFVSTKPLSQTLQAVPIFGADLTLVGNTAFNVVNAVFQQAIVCTFFYVQLLLTKKNWTQGIYPTVIIILVKMQKSLWEAAEIAPTLSHSHMSFVPPPDKNGPNGSAAITTSTAVASVFGSHHTQTTVGIVDLNRSGDLEKNGSSSVH